VELTLVFSIACSKMDERTRQCKEKDNAQKKRKTKRNVEADEMVYSTSPVVRSANAKTLVNAVRHSFPPRGNKLCSTGKMVDGVGELLLTGRHSGKAEASGRRGMSKRQLLFFQATRTFLEHLPQLPLLITAGVVLSLG
jgi:hypothetical protein